MRVPPAACMCSAAAACCNTTLRAAGAPAAGHNPCLKTMQVCKTSTTATKNTSRSVAAEIMADDKADVHVPLPLNACAHALQLQNTRHAQAHHAHHHSANIHSYAFILELQEAVHTIAAAAAGQPLHTAGCSSSSSRPCWLHACCDCICPPALPAGSWHCSHSAALLSSVC